MERENHDSPTRILVAAAVIIILILATAIPKEETFECASCWVEVTQVPNTAHSLPGYDPTFGPLYNLKYHDKLCDECYDAIKAYLEKGN